MFPSSWYGNRTAIRSSKWADTLFVGIWLWKGMWFQWLSIRPSFMVTRYLVIDPSFQSINQTILNLYWRFDQWKQKKVLHQIKPRSYTFLRIVQTTRLPKNHTLLIHRKSSREVLVFLHNSSLCTFKRPSKKKRRSNTTIYVTISQCGVSDFGRPL